MSQYALEIAETLVQAAQEVAQAQQTSLDCGVLLTVSNRHNRLPAVTRWCTVAGSQGLREGRPHDVL